MKYEQLWAPWRLAYIQRDQASREREAEERAQAPVRPGGDPQCFICRAVSGQNDREHWLVHRGEHVCVILNCFPYNNGHVLICPYEHHGRLVDFAPAVHNDALATLTKLTSILEQAIEAQGFNVGLNLGKVAGAGVPGHLHWHLVPRWMGDTNFMPVMTDVSVISQSLTALYDLLDEAFHPLANDAAKGRPA